MLAAVNNAASSHGFMMLAGAIVPMLLMIVMFPAVIRPRLIAASVGLVIATVTMTTTMSACDPCPKCTTAKLTTSDQTLTVVNANILDGGPVTVIGLPVGGALISQLSK
jgi:hypothetical protein